MNTIISGVSQHIEILASVFANSAHLYLTNEIAILCLFIRMLSISSSPFKLRELTDDHKFPCRLWHWSLQVSCYIYIYMWNKRQTNLQNIDIKKYPCIQYVQLILLQYLYWTVAIICFIANACSGPCFPENIWVEYWHTDRYACVSRQARLIRHHEDNPMGITTHYHGYTGLLNICDNTNIIRTIMFWPMCLLTKTY